MEMADQCSESGCELPAKTVVESRSVCLAHFFTTCYEKLDELNRDTRNWTYGGAEWESARRITKECAQKAADYSQYESGLSNLERARLLDITLWAAELGRRLRRSPRSVMNITIRLISEMPGRCWWEETHTVDVSRHGSRIICKHAVENDDILKVLRLDTTAQIEVRVTWHRRTTCGIHEIGVEAIGSKAFWSS
jgi:hypothetical protein